MNRHVVSPTKSHSYALAAGVAAGVLMITALVNRRLAKKAEKDNPPEGEFIEVNGVRLHYVAQGEGKTLVLLHGNGSMIQDFESSGLINLAARTYRVIAFDRPGYGYSERPPSTIWTPDAQAALIHAALVRLGIKRAVVLGHSWGASVAVALGLKFPAMVRGLILVSGYYYPTERLETTLLAGLSIPVIGDILRYTVGPIASRLAWPAMVRKIFGPAPTPEKFNGFPREMTFRPSQLGASEAEAAMMVPDAWAASDSYQGLKMPVVIVAGENDRLINADSQSGRLHSAIPHSTFHRVPGAGHMVHQTATDSVMSGIEEVARQCALQQQGVATPHRVSA
ncbi:MAG TPA: alpha/beta hydrolase [Roseiarcus sp.]|jgi:pimeloyl-ACP methyl ester carboxylesterase